MITCRRGLVAAATVCLFMVTGCVSASLEDAAPTSASSADTPDNQTITGNTPASDTAPEEIEVRDNSFVEEGAILDDTFPTFEQTPKAANEQISDEEKKRLLAEMEALKASMKRRGGTSGDSDARYRELQDLARKHADDTKKQIEQ